MELFLHDKICKLSFVSGQYTFKSVIAYSLREERPNKHDTL